MNTKDEACPNMFPSSVVESWMRENIYDFRKGDGTAYFVLYILIPVIITIVSLSELKGDGISVVYCYITILISALNGIYDGANRWKGNKKSVHNTKIFIILGANTFVAVYCVYVVMYILITKNLKCRFDWMLLAYFFSIAVSFADIIACFLKEMTLQNCVGRSGD